MPPADLARKAGNMQLMGILSIVFGFCCCSPVGLILSVVVIVQSPTTLALLQQIGQHRQTHIAGADKCDVHDVLLISTGGIPPLGKCAGDGDQGRIAAAGAED